MSTARIGAVALALLAAWALTACSDTAEKREPPAGAAEQAIMGGQLDTAGEFSAVVGVLVPGGFGTGVAISDRVVLTAGHLLPNVIRGCSSFTYVQPPASGGSPVTGVIVQTADSDGKVTSDPPIPANQYGVDAVVGRRRVAPLNAYDCCPEGPGFCDTCGVSTNGPNWNSAFDVALLHLDRPLEGVKPMKFVAKIGATDAKNRTYPIDPSTWPNNVIATLVGVGGLFPGGPLGYRKWGSTTITGLGNTFPNVVADSQCDASTTTSVTCADCMVHVATQPTELVQEGAVTRLGGDSGAPVIVNDTAHDGTPILGLPLDTPFIVGIGSFGTGLPGDLLPIDDLSVASWDTELGPGDPIGTGSFIQGHLGDWDLDGIPDDDDNCPLAPNPDQANCNQDAEDARGFPRAGDACDPTPCAASTPTAAAYAGQTVSNSYIDDFYGHAIQDVIDVTPRGSHYWSSGAQNHAPLPEVSVGTVGTHYRFCQTDPNNNVDCAKPSNVDVGQLNMEPTHPDKARPWMRVRMEAAAAPVGSPFDHESLVYPSDSVQRRWLYAADYSDWTTSGKISIPAECNAAEGCCVAQFGCGTNLDGRLWTHSSTTQGSVLNPVQSQPWTGFVPATTGFHPKSGAPSIDDLHLSSNYVTLAPDARTSHHTGKPLYPWPHFRWMWWWPDPMRPAGWNGSILQDTVLMPMAGEHVGLLLDNGRALVADDLVGAELRSALHDTSIRWVEPAEPSLAVASRRFNAGVVALGLAADGTAVTHRVMRSKHGIGTAAETGADQCATPPSEMLAWWSFDEGPADSAGTATAHPGEYQGLVAASNGVVGNAAFFPASAGQASFMSVHNDDGAFDLANDFTIEAWVHALDPQRAEAQSIVGRSGRWSVGIATDGTLQAVKQSVGVAIQTPVAVAVGRWQHVAVAFSRSGTFFYLDGLLVHVDDSEIGTSDISCETPNEPLSCGAAGPDKGFFEGWLDELSIYRRALSAEEIAAIVDAGAHGKCKTGAPPSAPPSGAVPPPREGYQAVLSRAENALFVLGGLDSATQAPRHDIWMQRLDAPGSWTEVHARGVELDAIVAATWSFHDRRLWVLDERVVLNHRAHMSINT